MDDVITISITELYGQLSGKRVVLCITKTVCRREAPKSRQMPGLKRQRLKRE